MILISCFFLQLFISLYCYALPNSNIEQFLINRKNIWPEWNLSNLQSSDIKKDLIYPSWFEGNWIVTSEDLVETFRDPVIYKVNFFKSKSGEILGDRVRNSESIGKAIFGEKLEQIKIDPKSFNNQIIYLKNNEFIESRVKGRSQVDDQKFFLADEFFIQIYHKDGLSRLNQVEIISSFFKCDNKSEQPHSDICGEQYIATYGSKVGDINLKAITTNKYKLTFKFIEH